MNTLSVKNAKLIGQAKYRKWKYNYLQEWNKPMVEIAKAEIWREIAPPVKDELAKRIPNVVENMNKKYGGK